MLSKQNGVVFKVGTTPTARSGAVEAMWTKVNGVNLVTKGQTKR